MVNKKEKEKISKQNQKKSKILSHLCLAEVEINNKVIF